MGCKMILNRYQKIIIAGKEIQKGDMDTPLKFQQLTQGIDLKGKKVLDVGCNCGMICKLATDAGAVTTGIDINDEYISQAKSLFPYLRFETRPAQNTSGKFDIIIASACLHYMPDIDAVFKLFSQHSDMVLCDVWLNDSNDPVFTLSHRDIFIPSKTAFLHIVGKYFKTIFEKGPAITPDISKRYIFHLSEPIRSKPKALLIYGAGNTGKTTLAQKQFGYTHLLTDNVFMAWKRANAYRSFSAKFHSDLSRGELRIEYIEFFITILKAQIAGCCGKNIVIEGYELQFSDLIVRVRELLTDWDVSEIQTKVNSDVRITEKI